MPENGVPDSSMKTYIIVREDLSDGARIVQSAHAMSLFHALDQEAFHAWQRESNYLVVLGVPSEKALLDLLTRAEASGASFALWREPDYDNEATAAVIIPGRMNASFLASLPLAGRTPAPVKASYRESAMKARAGQPGVLTFELHHPAQEGVGLVV